MRILTITSLSWFGGMAATLAGVLSFSATIAPNGIPDGPVDRVSANVVPAFYDWNAGNTPASSQAAGGGFAGGARLTQKSPWSQGVSHLDNEVAPAKAIDNAGSFTLASPGRIPSTVFGEAVDSGLSGIPPLPTGSPGSQDVRLSSSARTATASSLSFPLIWSPSFPSFPQGEPSRGFGQTSSGSGSSGTSSGSGPFFFIVGNNGNSDGSGFDGYGGGFYYSGGAEAVPEPTSWMLGCVAVGAAIYLRRRALRSES